jgi:hypothetical protein
MSAASAGADKGKINETNEWQVQMSTTLLRMIMSIQLLFLIMAISVRLIVCVWQST